MFFYLGFDDDGILKTHLCMIRLPSTALMQNHLIWHYMLSRITLLHAFCAFGVLFGFSSFSVPRKIDFRSIIAIRIVFLDFGVSGAPVLF